ncbi:MAG: benzoate-CoA ligase family protein [Rhodoplanes sp.]
MSGPEMSKAPINAADELLGPTLKCGGANNVAILFGDAKFTYGELNATANRFGNALKPNLPSGARALLLLKDSPDFVAAFLGIMRIGAVVVPLSTRSSAGDFAFVMEDSEARVLLIDEEFLPLYRDAIALGKRSPDLVIVRGTQGQGFPTIDAFTRDAASELDSAPTMATDVAFWLYTSGTTGVPKGAMHRHGDVTVGDSYLKAFGFGPGERVFSSSKMFFAFALGHVLIGGLRTGSTLVLYDGWPDGNAIAVMVERFRPSIMLSVPAFFRNLLREGQAMQPAFKAVRYYISAGESLPESLYLRWREVTGRPIIEGIGATETIFMMISGTPEEHKPGATGKPMPYVEAKLVDDDRLVTEAETPGVLWVRMGSLCSGYWRQPDKTAASFRDGWFRTGDVFVVGSDGWWRHQGRGDDLLKISGQWVSPSEIEECAITAPGVAEAVVVGVPDRDGLIRLAMFLVAAEGASEGLKRMVQEKLLATLSKYKCPRNIVFVDVIPRTPTGKVRRFRLRQWLTADLLGRLMQALSLDFAQVAAAQPQVIIEMQRRCAMCESQERCMHDLEEGVIADAYQEFCPNAETLVQMQFARQTS